jgi:hypothetical protein
MVAHLQRRQFQLPTATHIWSGLVTHGTAEMLNARKLALCGTARTESGKWHVLDLEASAFESCTSRRGLETERQGLFCDSREWPETNTDCIDACVSQGRDLLACHLHETECNRELMHVDAS